MTNYLGFFTRKKLLGLGFVLALAFLVFRVGTPSTDSLEYQTTKVERGTLEVTISATGTIEPEELVDVGAQVAGLVKAFGKNSAGQEVDYGVEVEEGTVLAEIDDSLYSSDVAVAEAQTRRAEADLLQLKAKLKQAEADWKRAQSLGASEALAKSSFDAFKSGYDVAMANVAIGEAALLQAQATLNKAHRNLSYTTIRSPVRGVIIDRRVNIGQTVVSSLNAPSLFLIAKDLKQMQVWVSVNEADIGSITVGQKATFTVDAFPGRIFHGAVGKIRLNASMTQNVVSYIVEVNTSNADGTLLPYLTANVTFEVDTRPDVLLVPNSALRWSPPELSSLNSKKDQSNSSARSDSQSSERMGTIWVLSSNSLRGKPTEMLVKTGATNGIVTEVSGENISEGLSVIIGHEQIANSVSETKNPFAPAPFRGNRRN